MTTTHEFKVGDRVRHKSNLCDGEIVSEPFGPNGCWIAVRLDQSPSDHPFVISLAHLEPLPPAPKWPERVTLVLDTTGKISVYPNDQGYCHLHGAQSRVIDLATPTVEELLESGYVLGRHRATNRIAWSPTGREGDLYHQPTTAGAIAAAREHYIRKAGGEG